MIWSYGNTVCKLQMQKSPTRENEVNQRVFEGKTKYNLISCLAWVANAQPSAPLYDQDPIPKSFPTGDQHSKNGNNNKKKPQQNSPFKEEFPKPSSQSNKNCTSIPLPLLKTLKKKNPVAKILLNDRNKTLISETN